MKLRRLLLFGGSAAVIAFLAGTLLIAQVRINGVTNFTGLTVAGNTVATTANKLSAFAATTSAELAGVVSNETGTGVLVFGTSPTLTTPTITLSGTTAQVLRGDGSIGTSTNGVLSGTTASLGGGLLAAAGSCATAAATVTGATAGQVVIASTSDGSAVSGLVSVYASVTGTDTVTVQLCAIAAVTPAAKTWNVRVLP